MSVHKVREKHHSAHQTALMMDLTALLNKTKHEIDTRQEDFSKYKSVYVIHVTPRAAYFKPQKNNLNKLGRGLLDEATYQKSSPCYF